jgi:MFS family permease
VIALAATLPAVIVSPMAGALVDRWDRRRVMIVSDALAAAATLVIATLYMADRLEVWHILVVSALGSTAGAFQGPAYTASVTLLVPKEHYGRASGMAQMARAIAQVLSPALAGLLLLAIGLAGVILIDFGTFLFAVGTLMLVRIPRPQPSAEGAAQRRGLWREALQGWTYIRDRGGLLGMLLLFAALNFILGMVAALGTPMLLSFTTPDRLGAILSVGGLGMLVGSLVMSAWGGPRRCIHGVLGFLVIIGLGLVLVGLRPSAFWAGTGFFVALAAAPVVGGCSQAIWQRKVPADLQGRVFATRGMIAMAATPLAYLLSGPLADRFFNPWLLEGGLLADRVGRIVGVGPGRGIGLMFVIAGVLVALASLSGYLNPRLRRVEAELPDADSALQPDASPDTMPPTPPAPAPAPSLKAKAGP